MHETSLAVQETGQVRKRSRTTTVQDLTESQRDHYEQLVAQDRQSYQSRKRQVHVLRSLT